MKEAERYNLISISVISSGIFNFLIKKSTQKQPGYKKGAALFKMARMKTKEGGLNQRGQNLAYFFTGLRSLSIRRIKCG